MVTEENGYGIGLTSIMSMFPITSLRTSKIVLVAIIDIIFISDYIDLQKRVDR